MIRNEAKRVWTFTKEERSNCSFDVDCVRYSMSASRNPKIIAVAGGKGGAGKTVFACMLGACLAGFDRRTVLVDLDFSGASMGGYLNMPQSGKTLNDYFAGRSLNLTDIIQRTSFDNLDAIPLRSGTFQTLSCKPWQKRRLFHELAQFKALLNLKKLTLKCIAMPIGIDFLRAYILKSMKIFRKLAPIMG